MLPLLLALSAQAAEPQLVAAAGVASTRNPFQLQPSTQLSLEGGPEPLLAFGLRGAFAPDVCGGDWAPITVGLSAFECHQAPLGRAHPYLSDVSRITLRAEAYARFTPILGEAGPWRVKAGALVGGGVVRTVDDLNALQALNDPIALATQLENHPSLVVGASAELHRPRLGVRVEATRVRYVETINSTTLELRRPLYVGVALTARRP